MGRASEPGKVGRGPEASLWRQATLLANAARTTLTMRDFLFLFSFLGDIIILIIVWELIVRKSMLYSLYNIVLNGSKFRVLVHVSGITKRSVEFSLFQIRGTLVLVRGIEIQTCICLGTMSGTLP